jgi:hypothetical protein
MAPRGTIVTCPNCSTRNRVRPTPSGIPRCSVCQALLPWMVEAGPERSESDRLVGAVPLPRLQAWLAPHLAAVGDG